MEQKIAPDVEHRLTRAIEKAASLMAVNMDRNPNELIAGQLKQANVDKKFARVAAQAFNKRATVIHLSKTADEHKADDFPLADPDTVYELCGGVVDKPLAKAASVTFEEGPFVFTYVETAPAMVKAASVAMTGQKPYEERVDVHVFHNHLESVMDKCANTFRDMNYEYDKLEKSIKERADGIARWFNKTACQSFEFTTAAKLFGQDLKRALGDRIPDMPLEKSANVVNPNTPVIKALGTLIDDMDKLAALKEDIVEFGKNSMDFIKTAAAWGEAYTRAGGKLMDKSAAPIDVPVNMLTSPFAQNMYQGGIDAAIIAPAAMAEGTTSFRRNVMGDMQSLGTSLLNHALDKYRAGRADDLDVSPGKVLDAEFINKDRLRDRMMAISDISADKGLAVYPFKDVFKAAMRAMDTNLALERPDRREVLRSYVAQLLAQNNRQGMADLAALGSVMDSRKLDEAGAVTIAKDVGTMSHKVAPERVKFETPSEWLSEKKLNLSSLDTLETALKDRRKEYREDQKDEAKSRKEYAEKLDTASLDALKYSEPVESRLKQLGMPFSDVRFVPDANGNIEVHATKTKTYSGQAGTPQHVKQGDHLLTLGMRDIMDARERVETITRMLNAGSPVNLFGKA